MALRSPGPNRLFVGLDRAVLDRALVGGKGASLSLLTALEAPVPSACALTTHAYRAVATALGLPPRMDAVTPADLPAIRDALSREPLPDSVTDAIVAAWTALGGDAEAALAVRSSATSEDSGAYSFAGLHDTVLDVRTPDSLETAVRACWASLWSDRAVAYRRGSPLAAEPAEIAVVVQRLVRADVAFVVFTADPISGNRDHVVISASWGLGEAIVSGLVTPDHIVVDPAGRVISRVIGAKEVMTIPGAAPGDGTREVPVPRSLRGVPVMDDERAAAIAALARGLAAKLGYPADIEGGIAGDAIWLFQARPITTLDEQRRTSANGPPRAVSERFPAIVSSTD